MVNQSNNKEVGHGIPSSLTESERFAQPKSRRDFLGIAAIWSALGTFIIATIGAIRLPMPSVFPESNPKAKIGPPDRYQKGSATYHAHLNMWVFRDEDGGIYAISSVCTHLGCIVNREGAGDFLCPCHGSHFSSDGKVIGGPAPSALPWLEITMSPSGQLVVDTQRAVPRGTRFMV